MFRFKFSMKKSDEAYFHLPASTLSPNQNEAREDPFSNLWGD